MLNISDLRIDNVRLVYYHNSYVGHAFVQGLYKANLPRCNLICGKRTSSRPRFLPRSQTAIAPDEGGPGHPMVTIQDDKCIAPSCADRWMVGAHGAVTELMAARGVEFFTQHWMFPASRDIAFEIKAVSIRERHTTSFARIGWGPPCCCCRCARHTFRLKQHFPRTINTENAQEKLKWTSGLRLGCIATWATY